MLTKKQVENIKQHLDKSQNPIFFFDNDLDGLCSFLLLRRYIGRGVGVPVKSFPELNESYFRKVHELKCDYIFILDKPRVAESFFKVAEQENIPVVWIDHHKIDDVIPQGINYFNPLLNKSENSEPVTLLCFQVSKRLDDLWIAIIGCISDFYLPKFYSRFKKQYQELGVDSNVPFEILYSSEIGKIARMLNFALKDRTSNVIKTLKFLITVRSPFEILEENPKTYFIRKHFDYVNKKYNKLLSKALEIGVKTKKILFFQYGGELSLSADLANELSYKFPDKLIVIAYLKDVKANISIRGEKARELTLKAIEGLEDATGGGHENATGARVLIEDLPMLKNNLMKLI